MYLNGLKWSSRYHDTCILLLGLKEIAHKLPANLEVKSFLNYYWSTSNCYWYGGFLKGNRGGRLIKKRAIYRSTPFFKYHR